ncbi:MAG: chromosome segregation protein SMC, partial [Bacteroidetes bacterium]
IGTDSARRREQGASLEIQRDQTTENSEALEIELTRLRKERNELDAVTTHAKDTLAEIKVAVSDLEARLRDIRRQREEVMSGNSRQNIRLAEIDTRLADLVDTMSEDYEIDITSFAMEIDDVFEAETARVEIREFRSRIRTLGPVNALALESFDEEKERLDFLRDQLADLEAAESTLMETINEINETASKRFNETFGAIQGNFAKLFRELFGEEACADVVLVNPDDPLESPIEVMARPKGKKLSVLAQLSGGEKTLTAIALLFAIYLVKPSPFCILDEVDAPLDDANVNRFMHMIRTFSDTTQFILVTHNKRTMEAADCMYGITMAEQGVSKLVSVKFDNKLELVA